MKRPIRNLALLLFVLLPTLLVGQEAGKTVMVTLVRWPYT